MQNFGLINETFKNIFVDSIISKDKKGKQIFKSYVKSLKENSVLKTQYSIYNKLENKINVVNEDDRSSIFVDECISILNKLGEKVIQENKKLINFLNKNGYKIVEGDYELKKLHEHITNLAYLDRNSKNIDVIIESKLFIKNYSKIITENNSVTIEPYRNKMLIPLLKKKFNDKYGNLNELEKKIFRLSKSGTKDEKINLFKTNITECLDLVNKQLVECNIEQKDVLLQVKDRLLRLSFNENNFINEMIKLNSLKQSLN